MDNEELEERRECADCGELVLEGTPHFELAGEIVLCYACAVRRGGQFDSARDEWRELPNLSAVPGAPRNQHHVW